MRLSFNLGFLVTLKSKIIESETLVAYFLNCNCNQRAITRDFQVLAELRLPCVQVYPDFSASVRVSGRVYRNVRVLPGFLFRPSQIDCKYDFCPGFSTFVPDRSIDTFLLTFPWFCCSIIRP